MCLQDIKIKLFKKKNFHQGVDISLYTEGHDIRLLSGTIQTVLGFIQLSSNNDLSGYILKENNLVGSLFSVLTLAVLDLI